MGKGIKYDIYRKGTGDRLGTLDSRFRVLANSAPGLELLLDQIKRGVAPEDKLDVVLRGTNRIIKLTDQEGCE